MRHVAPALAALITLAAAPAWAGPFTQPNGHQIPTPLTCDSGNPGGIAAILACQCTTAGVCNIGAACPGSADPNSCDKGQKSTCEETLWHDWNDNPCLPTEHTGLDPVKDALTTPETFHPSCPQTFDLLSRGTAQFKNAFGWYNVTGQKPDVGDLHVMQDCAATKGSSVVLDLASEPAYKGGDIGFFLVTPQASTTSATCAGGDCCATVARASAGQGFIYFSERKYNPDFVGANSYIHLLTYQSVVWKEKFYFAWEDTYGSSSDNFTDFVSGVSGIQCSGGGVLCDTGKQGACAKGVSLCTAGKLGCTQLFQPVGEVCNGLDDDCDGLVDNGAVCPPEEICFNGACVKHCSGQEFPCASGTECDAASGLCVDVACKTVSCTAGQVCNAGKCRTPCDGVLCPAGQDCVGDACLDLCHGVSCAAGQVCNQGKCFAGCNTCGGMACSLPEKCDPASGACHDPACPTGCPAGQACHGGQCQDACVGAVCPPGQTCSSGQCSGSGQGGAGGSTGTTSIGFGGGGSGTTGTSAGGGSGGEGGGATGTTSSSAGCGCAAAPARNNLALAMAALALLAPGARRRTRKKS
jgi:MYXO-CTERM domain-containing protein